MEEVSKRFLKLVCKGDQFAYEQLICHYKDVVYQLCFIWTGNEECASELASDTFLYAYSHLSNYLQTQMLFSTWLFQIVVRLGRKRTSNGKQQKNMNPLLHICIEERTVVFLYHVLRLSKKEIGEILEKSQSEIKGYLHSGRELLKNRIECKEHIAPTG